MEEGFQRGYGRRTCRYSTMLMEDVQTLKEKIREVEYRRYRLWASADEEIKKQREYINFLRKEKSDLLWNIRVQKERDYDNYRDATTGPKVVSRKTVEVLRQQIDALEEELKRLNYETTETGRKYHAAQKSANCNELRQKKSLEYKQRALHTERRIMPMLQTINDLRNSCMERQAAIGSILPVRAAFHKLQRNVGRLLAENRDDMKEVAGILACSNGERNVQRKLATLCERTKANRQQIVAGISEMKDLLATNPQFQELKITERLFKKREDPFSEKCRDLSYAEKKVHCEVLLSRIFHESGEHDTRSVCRKFSETEIENRRIFGRIETATSVSEKLLADIQALTTEIKKAPVPNNDISEGQRAEIDKIEKNIKNLRLESNQLEALVDRKDEGVAYAKRIICRLMDAYAPKPVLQKLRRTSIDNNLKLYLSNFEHTVKMLIQCLYYYHERKMAEFMGRRI